MRRFHGFDHIDTRVSALALVEPFYDRLMPELGMPRKNHAHVDENGDWHEPDEARPYNAVEYYEPIVSGGVVCFIGFIEDRAMTSCRDANPRGQRRQAKSPQPYRSSTNR